MKFYLTILIVLMVGVLQAQSIPPVIAEELSSRGIDRQELVLRLRNEGIDLAGKSEAEILRLRPQIEAVISEMEAEQRQAEKEAEEAAAESAEEITEAVQEGASVEEAISEVTQEAAAENLPTSRIYGHQIFRNKSLEVYRATKDASPPETYPLKPGDEIAITIFGASQTDFILRLDEDGFVQLPNTLRIPLMGVSLKDARQLLSRRLKSYYSFRDGQLSIRIQTARTVSVNIFGEVERNGTFTMSSLNTGFNALVAAGGPLDRGTVRNIQLIQGDETVIMDVYDYLQNPAQVTNRFIEDNSTIYVPLAEKLVQLQGGVLRPMWYELRDEEGLSSLIGFAGGVKPRAETGNIRVTRYIGGDLKIIDVDLSEQPDFELFNDDRVFIPTVDNPLKASVRITGQVLLPGEYAFEEGMTVQSLLDKGRLRPGAKQDAAFVFRTNDDGTKQLRRVDFGDGNEAASFLLQRGDVVRILAEGAFVDERSVTIRGAVRNESEKIPYPQDGGLTLEEAVLLAGGTMDNSVTEVMLIRTPTSNREKRAYQRLNLFEDQNEILLPNDEIVVYSNERFTDANQRVSIRGAVRQGGSYVYDESLTLTDLIYLSGGLTLSAATDRVEVYRLDLVDGVETRTLVETLNFREGEDQDFILKPFDEVVIRDIADFEYIQNVSIQGEVRYPGLYALIESNEKLTDLVARAGGLTEDAFIEGANLYRKFDNTGSVILDLEQALLFEESNSNMTLLAGDTLFVPKRRDLVTIHLDNTIADIYGLDSLATGRKVQVAWQGDRPADWYIKRFVGGFNDDTARKRWTTVQYPNGQILETKSFLGLRSYPEVNRGSTIRIPAKPPKTKKRQRRPERFDWIGLASVVAGAATTIVTLFLLRR